LYTKGALERIRGALLFLEVFLEMATQQVLERVTAEIPRTREYFSIRELQTMTGQGQRNFSSVIIKELVDNGIDECEAAGRVPEIEIDWAYNDDGILSISVSDNGRGMDPELVRRILDFNVRVSDKVLYRSPSRGAQGNALKTVVGIPYALGSNAPAVIESRGIKHIIKPGTDPLNNVQIDHQQEKSPIAGTRVTVQMPGMSQEEDFCPEHWAQGFAIYNPHATVRIRYFLLKGSDSYQGNFPDGYILKSEKLYQPTVKFLDGWTKFLPTDPTSPHWYSVGDMKSLIYAHVKVGKNLTLREFVKTFKGLFRSDAAKSVCDQFPGISRLSDIQETNVVADLLAAMKAEAKKPKKAESILGCVGKEHFRQMLDRLYVVKDNRFWYEKDSTEVAGIPYFVEVAVAETEEPGSLFHGVNFSLTFSDPIEGVWIPGSKISSNGLIGYLNSAHCKPNCNNGVHTAVVFHLVSPGLEFLDKGKTHLPLPRDVAAMIGELLWPACKTIYQEEKRREKDAARQGKKDRARGREREREPNTQKDVVFHVLPQAFDEASGGGLYPVYVRGLYYQVRPLIQQYTNKELGFKYFSQDLLIQYQQEHGPINGLYYDPRGVLHEPHTGNTLELGTKEVDQYVFPEWVYDKILFVEKKCLWPILEAGQLAERYDMSIIVSQGYATQAARTILQRADKDRDYRIFVLHDADPAGYNIARTLQYETRRMPGYHVDVVDIGLKLEDALDMGLQCEEFTRQNALPCMLELNDLEREYFEGCQAGKKSWICKRVELNAMSAPQLVKYIEAKLAEAGAREKVLPPTDVVEAEAVDNYTDKLTQMVEDEIKQRLDISKLVEQVLESTKVADFSQLRDALAEKLVSNPPESWRELVKNEAELIASSVVEELKWDEFLPV
jgi:hypothetical protein